MNFVTRLDLVLVFFSYLASGARAYLRIVAPDMRDGDYVEIQCEGAAAEDESRIEWYFNGRVRNIILIGPWLEIYCYQLSSYVCEKKCMIDCLFLVSCS